MDDGRPIFLQIAQQIEDAIIDGALADGDQAPLTEAELEKLFLALA